MNNDNLHGYYIEDLEVGMSASYARTVTESDIRLFSGVSGDDNPIHINREFAESTRFGQPIAHGLLSVSYISTILGTRLPGPGVIYVDQQVQFKAPVFVGDTVTAIATITGIDAKRRRVKLETNCFVKGKLVISGEATMLVDSKVG